MRRITRKGRKEESQPENYNEFCKSMNCPEYVEWSFGHGGCVSCRKIGQTYNITEYPKDCNFIDKIKPNKAEKEQAKE